MYVRMYDIENALNILRYEYFLLFSIRLSVLCCFICEIWRKKKHTHKNDSDKRVVLLGPIEWIHNNDARIKARERATKKSEKTINDMGHWRKKEIGKENENERNCRRSESFIAINEETTTVTNKNETTTKHKLHIGIVVHCKVVSSEIGISFSLSLFCFYRCFRNEWNTGHSRNKKIERKKWNIHTERRYFSVGFI